jgi:rhodanese-related sulfurtransferase
MRARMILRQWFAQCFALAIIAVVIAGCGGAGVVSPVPAPERHDVTAAELQAMMDDGQPLVILDVRTAQEYAAGHIPGAVNAPLADLDAWVSSYNPTDRLATVCRAGSCSRLAADQLVGRGFTDVYNLLGGMDAWPGPVEQ